jgi:hypothetical protein
MTAVVTGGSGGAVWWFRRKVRRYGEGTEGREHMFTWTERECSFFFVSIHLFFGSLLLLDLLFTTTSLHMTTQIKKIEASPDL